MLLRCRVIFRDGSGLTLRLDSYSPPSSGLPYWLFHEPLSNGEVNAMFIHSDRVHTVSVTGKDDDSTEG